LDPATLREPLDIPLRRAGETSLLQHRRMEQVGGCTNFLKRLIRQTRYAGKLLACSFVGAQFLLQQGNGYFQGGECLPDAVVQVASYPAPFFVLRPEKLL